MGVVEDAAKWLPLPGYCGCRIAPRVPKEAVLAFVADVADPELRSATVKPPAALEPVVWRNSQLNTRVSNYVTSP